MLAALSLIFVSGCEENNTSLSDMAYQAMNMSGLFVEKGEIFKTSYNEGYNLNFEISLSQANELLPDDFTPLSLKITESESQPHYYLSWYMAVMDTNGLDPVNRIDLFTYATDPQGELTLYFVSSYISVPQSLIDLGMYDVFKEIFDAFARDSATGEPAYPHFYTNEFSLNSDTFNLVYEDSSIGTSPCAPVSATGTFTREFVMANSQIYRNAYDKNVNYFNQNFMKANVETRSIDPSCISHANIAGFHPYLSGTNLRSVQFYGSSDKKITWYYETCTNNVCSNPFIW